MIFGKSVRATAFAALSTFVAALAFAASLSAPAAAAGPTSLVGNTNLEASVDSNSAGSAEAFQYTAAVSGAAGALFVYLEATNAATQVALGLYSNAVSNVPGSLLAQGVIVNPANGAWNSVAVSTMSITAGQKYWIAVLSPAGAGTVVFRDKTSGGGSQNSTQSTLAALPTTWAPGPAWSSSAMSAYVATTGDSTPPTVTMVQPTNGATGVTLSALVIGDFTEGLDPASVNASTMTLTPAVPSTVMYNASSREAWIQTGESGQLQPNTTYTATLKGGSSGIKDLAGNPLATDYVWSFTTIDTLPPVISNVAATNVTSSGVVITWTTNEPADSQVDYGTTVAGGYGLSGPLLTSLVTTHTSALTGLSAGTYYHFRVKSRDAGGYLAASIDYTFTTAALDTTPPTVTTVSPANGASGVAAGVLVGGAFSEALDPATVNAATVTLAPAVLSTVTYNAPTHEVWLQTGGSGQLQSSTTYTATFKGGSGGITDLAGNPLAADYVWSFTTGDTLPPVISALSSSSVTTSSAVITWTTNEASDGQVEYGTSTAYGASTTLLTSLVTAHSASLTSLVAGTTYHYRVKSRDAAGNLATSADLTFTTTAATAVQLVGDSKIEASKDSNTAGMAEAFQYTATNGGVGNRVYVYLDTTNAASSVVVGLYANTTSNDPGTLLAQATITSPIRGAWNSVTLPTNVTVSAGTPYWIAVLGPAGAGTVRFRDVGSGGRAQSSSQANLTSLPITWSPGTSWANSPMSAYIASAP